MKNIELWDIESPVFLSQWESSRKKLETELVCSLIISTQNPLIHVQWLDKSSWGSSVGASSWPSRLRFLRLVKLRAFLVADCCHVAGCWSSVSTFQVTLIWKGPCVKPCKAYEVRTSNLVSPTIASESQKNPAGKRAWKHLGKWLPPWWQLRIQTVEFLLQPNHLRGGWFSGTHSWFHWSFWKEQWFHTGCFHGVS